MEECQNAGFMRVIYRTVPEMPFMPIRPANGIAGVKIIMGMLVGALRRVHVCVSFDAGLSRVNRTMREDIHRLIENENHR
ncbi:MAG: hypothetical protein FD175_2734 [Beijerinckiaceae bacterium]|nr:MAG: hypothetical protein FD175_2734 [Beijerinckiaceae bacterium]